MLLSFARQCEINQLYECNYPCAVTLAYSGAFCSVQVKTASKSLHTCLRQKMSQRVSVEDTKKSPGFNWRRKDVRGSPTRSGKFIRMSCIKAFERGIASTLNNLAEVFDAMTIAFISFFLFVSQGGPGPSGVFESDLTKYVSSPGSRADRE